VKDNQIKYLRISVTDRCNLRCKYCMPENGINLISHNDILRYEEIIRLMKIFEKIGIKKFRITGGEPLVRKGIINFLKEIENFNIYLTTNLNVEKNMIEELNKIKIKGINISLDSLKPEIYKYLTGSDKLNQVIENIRLLENLEKKINVVIIRNVNDNEIFDFINFSIKNNVIVRFIEKMNMINEDFKYVSNQEIIEQFRKKGIIEDEYEYTENHTTKYYKIRNSNLKIGFINAQTEPFCSYCDKLRLTSDGRLLLCLFDNNGFDLKEKIRKNNKDEEVEKFLKEIIKEKKTKKIKNENEIKMYAIGG